MSVVVIAGMHRSGTSMIARLLNASGLYLGAESDLVGPALDNPEGFWEHTGFVQINDEILARLKGAWDVPPALKPGWQSARALSPARTKARALIKQFDGQPAWGWKDPRSSLTLPFWTELIPDLKVIVCVRNPLEVARSLARRGYASTLFSLNLWRVYNQAVLENVPAEKRLVTHYESYFADPQAELMRVLDFAGIQADDEVIRKACAGISTSLRHARSTVEDLAANRAPADIIALYVTLASQAGPVYQGDLYHPNLAPAPVADAGREEPELGGRPDRVDLTAQEQLFLQARLAERETALGSMNANLAQQANTISTLTAQAARQEQAVDALSAQMAEQQRAVQELTGKIEEKDLSLRNLNARVAQHDSESRALRVDLDKARGGLQWHRDRLAILQAQLEEMQSGLAYQVMDKYRRGVERHLPAGSRRREYYNLSMKAFRTLVIEGPSALWQKIRYRQSGLPAAATQSQAPAGPAVSVAAPIALDLSSSVPAAGSNKYAAAYEGLLATTQGGGQDDFVPYVEPGYAGAVPPLKLIAFYLPQFHPIPENDEWWGRGFTEWTNVSKAMPQFIGHYQPHLPGELGFYDLRVPEVQERQVELARNYGISGFCFYYYWFNGKRLLERPLDQYMNNPHIDFPFCLCWANENWTRRWDGYERDILMEQKHDDESDFSFIKDILPILGHRNYMRVDGRPVVILYRVSLLPNPKATVRRWKEYCRSQGVPEPYFVAAQTFGFFDPREVDFDAAVEFPPHNYPRVRIDSALSKLNPQYQGRVFNYADIAAKMAHNQAPYTLFHTVFPSWDNEPRMPGKGFSFAFSSPRLYQAWLTRACRQALKNPNPDERLVFLNAWNEWGEGAYLEPDRRYGYAYLQATATALQDCVKALPANVSIFDRQPVRAHDTAVIVHLYYPELWGMIESRLNYMIGNYDLFISVPENVDAGLDQILQNHPDAYIYRCENRGRDVRPFLEIYREIYPLGYQYICKLHTKKTSHRMDGDRWRQDMLDKLIGSPEIISRAKRALDGESTVGLIAPYGHIISSRYYMGENIQMVKHLATAASVPFEGRAFLFAAGSMFWCKPDALAPLAHMDALAATFEPEQGKRDGTTAHAFERFFGLLVGNSGYQLAEMDAQGVQPATEESLHRQQNYPFAMGSVSDPIIIYQMGKVGSRSVLISLEKAIKDLNLFTPVYHRHMLHDLDNIERLVRSERKDPKNTLAVIEQGRELRREIDKNPNQRWNLISLVRDPVARNIAAFFQGLEEVFPDWAERFEKRTLSMDEMQEKFLELNSIHNAPDQWFDSQLKPVFDIDVYDSAFPTAAGYDVYESLRARMLLIRLEDLDRVVAAAMQEFLGIYNFRLQNTNVGEKKDYAALYQAFKDHPLPADYLRATYASRFARHFYSDQELEAFTRHWAKEKSASAPQATAAPAPERSKPIEKARNISDDDWLNMLIKSLSRRTVKGIEFPGFPPDALQAQFVGNSGEASLREAFRFYVLVKKYAQEYQNPIRPETRFLDFGCGWGRFLRFFWKDVEESNLYGCDINQLIVNTCHGTNVPGQIDLIEPLGRLPYPDNHFDSMMAYSVFTHLPEPVHLHWMRELARVARPGCVFALTLEPRRFIDFIGDISADTNVEWHKLLLAHKARVPEFQQTYEAGNVAFMPTNKGVESTYGDAVVPLAFIEREWSPYFRVCAYIDDPKKFWQAVLVVQRSSEGGG